MTRKRQGKQTVTKTSIVNLEAARTSIRDQYGRATSTRTNYQGYIKRGREFLANLVSQRRHDNTQDDIDTNLLAVAFDDPPNKYSVLALELFLTQECCEEEKGKNTAAGIQGAFCDMWDNMGDGGRYSGNYYQFNFETNQVYGCPGRAPAFRKLIKVINNKSKTENTRRHAEAINISAMKQTIDWSESQYPSQKLQTPPKDDQEKKLALKHAGVRSMFTLGFTLWTRNSELIALKVGDVQRNCPGVEANQPPHDEIYLHHRKGWQNKSNSGSGDEGVLYELHHRPDIPQIDAKPYLDQFLAYREMITGKPPDPDEYLFPYMSSNGAVHFDRPMTRDLVQQHINKFTSAAGLMVYYTTHCFRRGGAQYRYIYAPVRWSLNAVRWWGGWTEGESIDTLVKYLLDCAQKHEKNYSSQLLVDAPQTKPATVEDIRALGYTLTAALTSAVPNVTPAPLMPSQGFSMYAIPGAPPMLPVYPGCYPIYYPTTPTSDHSINQGSSVSPSDTSISHDLNRLRLRSTNDAPLDLSDSDSSDSDDSVDRPNSTLVRIPDLPRRHHRIWLEAVKQWETVDPQLGIALCDWPVSWYTGSMKSKTAMKRRSRKVVWDEYQRLGGTVPGFLERHPYADHISFSRLVRILNKNNGSVHRRKRAGINDV